MCLEGEVEPGPPLYLTTPGPVVSLGLTNPKEYLWPGRKGVASSFHQRYMQMAALFPLHTTEELKGTGLLPGPEDSGK